MLTIVIKKSPGSRLFDRMPMPRPKVRHLSLLRRDLRPVPRSKSAVPFSVRVSRIQ